MRFEWLVFIVVMNLISKNVLRIKFHILRHRFSSYILIKNHLRVYLCEFKKRTILLIWNPHVKPLKYYTTFYVTLYKHVALLCIHEKIVIGLLSDLIFTKIHYLNERYVTHWCDVQQWSCDCIENIRLSSSFRFVHSYNTILTKTRLITIAHINHYIIH